ncbi:MAG TPA: hypothetical protein VFJ99_04395 [Solirubrobacterales bacterium]|nr:hypothetical protein [Solirubrobacterales bacterium]
MDYGDGGAAERHLGRLGQSLAQVGVVDVAVDRVHDRAERFQLEQQRGLGEVAGVDRRLGLRDELDAALRQGAAPLRHVGVGEDRDQPVAASASPSP